LVRKPDFLFWGPPRLLSGGECRVPTKESILVAVQRSTHPSADTLKAFGLGKLDDSSSGVVMDHLDQCDECRNKVAALSGDDFLQRLREAHSRSSTPAPAKSLTNDPYVTLPPSQTPIPNLLPQLANNPHYEILRELGRGGMGVVYLAHNKLMDRLEVLKVVNKALLDHAGAVERFLREIRAAAKLSHANVVAAYHALQVGDLLAFAMEYVEGEDLASLVKSQGPLPVPHACFYVQQAALGLQHAFEKKMVHRDIKPQNLILAREGKKHLVKVLDFGLAKVMREKTDDTGLTGEGKMLGTPDYIAPEQTLDAAKADIRADIYSLGCTLYFLLSGRPPFSASSLGAILLAHQMQEAKPLNLVRPEVPEELAAVVRKMMAKSPAQRYQTPQEVVQALSPFVKQGASPKPSPELSMGTAKGPAGKPVKSESPPAPIASAKQPPPVPESPPAVAWEALTEGTSAFPQTRRSGVVRKRRPPVRKPWLKQPWLVGSGMGVGVLLLALLGMWTCGVLTKVKTPDGNLIVEANEPNSEVFVDGAKVTVSWHNGGKKAEISVKPGTRKVEVKKDGFTVYGEEVEIEDGKRRILSAKLVRTSLPPVAVLAANSSDYDLTGGYRFVHFGKNGTRVVLLFNDNEQKQYFARVYDLATGQALSPPLRHAGQVVHASFSPDGQRVVTTSDDKTAQLWDAASGKKVTSPLKHDSLVYHASFSPDSNRVVTVSYDTTARLWEAATGKEVAPPLQHRDSVVHASFSSDGQRVVTASLDKRARLWDAANGKELTPPLEHGNVVYHASFSSDGRRVVTASQDQTARLWDAATGKEVTPPLKHTNWVNHASFNPDGTRVVTASLDLTARLWDAATGEEVALPLRHNGAVLHVSFSPDGKRVVTAGNETTRLWDTASGKEITPPGQHGSAMEHASFSPDGKWVVTVNADGTAWLWDAATGKELKKVTITPD
jgi:serine/threonine protein kinase/WD40 repeat protein